MSDTATFEAETGVIGDPIDVVSFDLVEALDRPYRGLITLEIGARDADVTTLLGADLAVTLRRGDLERRFVGVVETVWEAAPTERVEERTLARVELSPGFALLALNRNTRMFQEKTALEIVEEVLGEALGAYGREVRNDCADTYPTREYCMQYQESDFDFVSRLLSEEGAFYTFEHDGDVEVMVLADANDAFVDVPSAATLTFEPHALERVDETAVHRFARVFEHTTNAVTVRQADWSLADPLVEANEEEPDARGRVREAYEHGLGRGALLVDYAEPSYGDNDAAAKAPRRLEAHRARERRSRGASQTVGLRPGTRFALSGHPTVGFDDDYYVTRARHTGSSKAGAGATDAYECRFECHPLAIPHRPAWTATKPSIASVQTAIVTGPGGEEIHTDVHGRVKVQFAWDRDNPADDTSSCWLRCEQAWAGPGWGFWWLPRVGMEVVVRFIDGDPDRPVVTGCVYNGDNPPPYPLPDEKTKSTIKSNSSPGGGGFNEVRFEDAAGSEELYVHAQKDYNEIVLNDHTTTVHHDQSNEVDNDQTQDVGANQTETIGGNQEMSVGGDRTVHVAGDFEETVDGTETRHTTGDVSETFAANETRDVTGDVTETFAANETRTVGAAQTETIGGSQTVTIGAASTQAVGGSYTYSVAGNVAETTGGTYTLIVGGSVNIDVAGASVFNTTMTNLLAPGGVTWIDYEDTWLGTIHMKIVGSESALVGLKLENGAAAMGLGGLKCEQAAVELGNATKWDRDCAAMVETDGAEVSTGVLKKWGYGILGLGG